MTNNETKYVSELAEERRLLQVQLAESKQREATLTLERDAARNSLDQLGEKVSNAVFAKEPHPCIFVNSTQLTNAIDNAVSAMGNPTAALAERDRAIEQKTAERCIEIMQSNCYSFDVADVSAVEIRREFKLDALT